jgi:thymidylate synthase (FAD)
MILLQQLSGEKRRDKMIVITPYVDVQPFDGVELAKKIERAGRVCYKSEEKIGKDTYENFIRRIIRSGHESVLEHEKITVKIVCDRGVSHEIVRHRIAAYSQESTRYCNYSADRFQNNITFIEPFFFYTDEGYQLWEKACQHAEETYLEMLRCGFSPQEARSVLPNSLKTEIVVTYNLREWRHFFELRAEHAAHPQMQQIAIPLLLFFKDHIPCLFDDIDFNRDFSSKYYADVRWAMFE